MKKYIIIAIVAIGIIAIVIGARLTGDDAEAEVTAEIPVEEITETEITAATGGENVSVEVVTEDNEYLYNVVMTPEEFAAGVEDGYIYKDGDDWYTVGEDIDDIDIDENHYYDDEVYENPNHRAPEVTEDWAEQFGGE